MRKAAILMVLNGPPAFWFFYNSQQKYMDMKKHLVKRYLIHDDEILYKRQWFWLTYFLYLIKS